MMPINAGALMRHSMIVRQQELIQNALRPICEHRSDTSPDTDAGDKLQMTEARIYVGLNDAETRKQECGTDRYLSQLKNICRSYHVAFSVDVEEGGYYHEDGEYTEETSLVLELIDTDRSIVHKIAKDLCAIFHQESVLVTESRITGRFIREGATE